MINISGGQATKERSLENAVTYAVGNGCLVIGTAGNDLGNKEWYPGSNANAFCVGNTNDDDTRAGSSKYGTWVDIAAPGVNVTSTVLSNQYGAKMGTSMSAPLVFGSAADVWTMHPSWTAAQVRQRLEKTAVPLDSTLQIGVRRIDLFEAVFDGSFELGDLSEW